ncbi:MAG: crossover junction endodeoxyribonuclease RuvC [Candidatus Liptonbacteria bacterium]|nr:crossover junction endodeoxyribonuclease RuvC [Candidatus Liptonbacteria bacterium]
MVILGLDPGTARIGYGIIKKDRIFSLLDCGILKITKGDNADRLMEAADHLRLILEKYRPNLLAVEKLFFMKNQKTAMAVAEVRGALIMLSKEAGVRIAEYAPTEIKKAVAGSGRADKKAVGKMVKFALSLKNIPGPDDITDAIAVALTAGYDFEYRVALT